MSDKPDMVWVGEEPWWSPDKTKLVNPTLYIRADLDAAKRKELVDTLREERDDGYHITGHLNAAINAVLAYLSQPEGTK